MNTDIRIAIGLTSNPKVLKLMKRCGDRSFFCLISLWTWAAQNRPDGNLEGMDAEDVELSSKWTGAEGCFIGCLKDLRFIDQEPDGSFSIHDWAENNPWAAEAKERSEAARLSRLFRKNPGAAQMLKTQGRVGITPDEYQLYVRETKEERTKYDRTANPSTPAPVPVPAPDPEPTPKEVCTNTLLKAFCAEPQKDEVQAPSKSEHSDFPGIVDEKPQDKKSKQRAKASLDLDGLPQDLRRDVILAFVESRKALRKPLTQRALLMCCKDAMRCQELHGIDPNDAMEKAIGKGWMTCDPEYFSSQKKPGKPSTGSDKHGRFSEKDYGTGGLI